MYFFITEFSLKMIFSHMLSSNSLGETSARLNISCSASFLILMFTFALLIH